MWENKRLLRKDVATPILATKHEINRSMPWRDRLRYWTRWTSAISKVPPGEDSQDSSQILQPMLSPKIPRQAESFPHHHVIKSLAWEALSDHGAKRATQQRHGESVSSYWAEKRLTNFSVIFGHVVHQVSENTPTISVVKEDVLSPHETRCYEEASDSVQTSGHQLCRH